MRQQGIVTTWNDEKGFGFITPSAGGSRVFVHISAFPRGYRPMENDVVRYHVTQDSQKRLRAEKILFQRDAARKQERTPGLMLALTLSGAFFSALFYFVLAGIAPLIVVGFYALMSVASFIMYALDKSAARRGSWRTAEATLHLSELIGGWPGALVAQRFFRHKTRKQPFQFVFWTAVVVNTWALAWLLLSEEATGIRGNFGIG